MHSKIRYVKICITKDNPQTPCVVGYDPYAITILCGPMIVSIFQVLLNKLGFSPQHQICQTLLTAQVHLWMRLHYLNLRTGRSVSGNSNFTNCIVDQKEGPRLCPN